MSLHRPLLTVIVPVHNGRHLLPDTLGAIRRSDLPEDRREILLVDDGSSDGSGDVAGPLVDRVVRLDAPPRGPAFARNRGAEAARGDVLVFVDADVRLAPDALSKLAEVFEADRTLGAAFGSYDDQPPAPGTVSRYRNLLHHYHHHRGAGEAETFWAGLGAVRSSVFREVGGFDEVRYARPQIEDIELGRRIRHAGYRIVLDPTIQGAHLKRWTLGQVLKTDLFHRGIPWMRLILGEGGGANTLNVKPKEKLCVGLVGLGLAGLFGAFLARSWVLFAAGLLCLAVVVLLNLELYRYLSRGRGLWFAAAVAPLHLTYYLTSGVAYIAGHIAYRFAPPPPPGAPQALQPEAHDG